MHISKREQKINVLEEDSDKNKTTGFHSAFS